jgi:hypothetical protein
MSFCRMQGSVSGKSFCPACTARQHLTNSEPTCYQNLDFEWGRNYRTHEQNRNRIHKVMPGAKLELSNDAFGVHLAFCKMLTFH